MSYIIYYILHVIIKIHLIFIFLFIGICPDVTQRINIYRERISTHLKAIQLSQEAKLRNDNRASKRKQDIKQFKNIILETLQKQYSEACQQQNLDKILQLIEKGCDCNIETSRGLTPLLCMILYGAEIEQFDKLFSFQYPNQVDINYMNK